MDKTAQNCIKKLILVFSGAFAAVFSAQYASFFKDNKTTTFDLKFPFVDNENVEFFLNYSLQTFALFVGTFLYTGIEVAMIIFENFATLVPNLICNEFAQIIDMYEQKQLTEPKLRAAFKNTLVMSLDYERYVFI